MNNDKIDNEYRKLLADCSDYFADRVKGFSANESSVFLQVLIDIMSAFIFTMSKKPDAAIELVNDILKERLERLRDMPKANDE